MSMRWEQRRQIFYIDNVAFLFRSIVQLNTPKIESESSQGISYSSMGTAVPSERRVRRVNGSDNRGRQLMSHATRHNSATLRTKSTTGRRSNIMTASAISISAAEPLLRCLPIANRLSLIGAELLVRRPAPDKS